MSIHLNKHNRLPVVVFVSLVLVLAIILSAGIALASGQADISLSEVYRILLYKVSNGFLGNIDGITQADANIVWFVRTPRILLSIFVGIGLAVSGAVMQAVVQNPLADPYILGISSGSSLGATFAILVGFGGASFFFQFGLALGAFVGAVAATFLVLLLSSIGGRMTSTKLVLSGTIISSLCSSLANLIVYLANNAEGMKTVTFWSMGSLASASWTKLPMVSLLVVGLTIFFLLQYRVLNTMLLGDEVAVTLGVKLVVYRRIYMVLSALLTSIIVANSGMIGFVGLIIPHIVRGFSSSDHRILMPLTALSGGLFLIWADILARSILTGVELPIGIITAIIGAPIFIYIIVKRQYNFGG
ncbi:FecCD family ABC transporter permease [Enterococcus italicus]|uniref:FecCD family ABC transporter permease n=1 Tax=Enterococcus italicus TaxID=246144 RepID=UPI0028B26412|nr:iron ABC transporter permease [Enterococcus italicus]